MLSQAAYEILREMKEGGIAKASMTLHNSTTKEKEVINIGLFEDMNVYIQVLKGDGKNEKK
jgi:hypothetical protein